MFVSIFIDDHYIRYLRWPTPHNVQLRLSLVSQMKTPGFPGLSQYIPQNGLAME